MDKLLTETLVNPEFDKEYQAAQDKVNEMIKHDRAKQREKYDINAQAYSYLENCVLIQPTNVMSYLDRVSSFNCKQKIIDKPTQDLLLEPIPKPKNLEKVKRTLLEMEIINTDKDKIIAPAIYTIRYYKEIYKHRKIYYDGAVRYQLEYTCDIVDDIWLYILTEEFRRVNPNSTIKFKWVNQPKNDFIDGYFAYFDIFNSNTDLNYEYSEFIIKNFYNRLKILAKLDMLIFRFYPCLRNYPKFERHGICIDIRRSLTRIGALIQEGASCKSVRKNKYQEAIGELHTLMRLITLSENMQYISINNGINTRLAIGELISMARSMLQTELSGPKYGTLRLNQEK